MPLDLGDRYSGCTLYGSFTTVTTTGAPTAISGLPGDKSAGNAFLAAWKAEQPFSCSTAGITERWDCNGAVGWNTFSVNTNASPTFYSCGKDYLLVLHGGTVGGTCVSYYTIATFSLKNRAALLPTISGRPLDVSATGEAGVDWANVGSPTTAVALSCTTTFSLTSVTNAVNAILASPTTVQAIACTVWDETRARFGTCGTFGFLLDCAVHTVTPSVTATSSFTEQGLTCTVWNEVRSRYGTCGTFGYLLDCNVAAAVQPTTPGRRLDVSATGEAGVDWANIGSPQTVQRLGCTSLFEMHRVCNAVTALSTPDYTEQGIACTVWNSVRSNYGTCGTFGFLVDCSVSAALRPTTPGRTLDVTATGAAGVDWGNVENPTTAVNLDCTTAFKVHSVDNAIRADACSTIFSVQSVLNSVRADSCSAIFSVQSVLNSVRADSCSAIFSVQSVTNAVNATIGLCSTVYRLETISNTAAAAILDQPITEPTGVFAWASATLRNIIGFLGALGSNRIQQSASQQGLCDRAASLRIAVSEVSCSAGVVTRGSFT